MFSRKIAIDLGTANSLVYVSGKGVVFREPTVVAVSVDDERIMAVGEEARVMLGKTPENITASRPLKSGVIADYQTTEAGALTKLFSDGAKAEIHRKAEGLPRAVNTVCFRSIIMAALKERKVIDSSDLLLDGPADG